MWCLQGRSCQNIEFEVEKRKGEAAEIGRGQIIMAFLCDDEFLKLDSLFVFSKWDFLSQVMPSKMVCCIWEKNLEFLFIF